MSAMSEVTWTPYSSARQCNRPCLPTHVHRRSWRRTIEDGNQVASVQDFRGGNMLKRMLRALGKKPVRRRKACA